MMGNSRLLSQNVNIVWLLVFGISVLFLPVLLITLKIVSYTHGIFIYPFDDTFIHLTIADNLLNGNWGINDNEFASASSSILYTLILALFRVFSNSVMIPFVVNCIAGIAILLAILLWLKKHAVHPVAQGIIILLIVFFTPLPLLIISGMEHTLQCLFSFLFIFYFSDWLEQNHQSGKQVLPAKILFFGVLVSTIRYEGLFLVAIACVLLLLYKRVFSAIALGIISVIPLVIFGLISLHNGNYFLPNSVLVKSESFNYSNILQVIYTIVFDKWVVAKNGMAALATQRLLIILPLVYLVFKKYVRPPYSFIIIFLFGATVLQLSFASTGYLYRYEAYLFFGFMIIFPLIFFKYGKEVLRLLDSYISKISALALTFFLFFPVVLRSATAMDKTAQACINIYDQQYQMALFAKKYYDKSSVALNDIGAVGYFTDAKIVDLWGLASIEVAKSKKQHYWTAGFLDSLCRSNGVKMAIIYDSWFSNALTSKWNKVASWNIQNNVICGDSMVSFYAVETTSRDTLRQQLEAFQPQLPASVEVKYY